MATEPKPIEDQIPLSWSVEYAKSGRSKCQITKEAIPKGAVRIGMEVDNPFVTGKTMFLWCKVDALFDKYFKLGKANKKKITSTDELTGYQELKEEDQDYISSKISALNELQTQLAQVDKDAIRLEHTKNGGVFWSIVQNGSTTRVRWGPINDDDAASAAAGNVSEKNHKDEETASKFVTKMIAQKEKGGYKRVDDKNNKADDDDDDTKAKNDEEDDDKKKKPAKKRKSDDIQDDDDDKTNDEASNKAMKTKESTPSTPASAGDGGADGGDEPTKIYGWMAEYAKSGRSKCQITKEAIPKGTLRIGMEIDNPYRTGKTMHVWHLVEPLFKSFRLGASGKTRITSTDEINGFDDLEQDDQNKLKELIDEQTTIQKELEEVDADATRLEHTKNGGVFWSIVQSGKTTRVRWGPLDTNTTATTPPPKGGSNISEKVHKTEEAATKFMEKKIAEKEKGGYVRTTS